MASMMMFHVPDDPALLAAFGEVALRHEHLSHILRMTIKTLAGLEVNEALDATAFDGAAILRNRVRKLARQRFGEGQTLLKVQSLTERCRRATERRNDYVHSVWAQELDGEAKRRGGNRRWLPIPSVAELQTLSQELQALAQELNHARLEGFIFEAIVGRGSSR
ncbi:MAG: hypothetical protein HP492_09585 [Nitrospira sp.]|nr:hypothetical protein [Nitrospira sp.]